MVGKFIYLAERRGRNLLEWPLFFEIEMTQTNLKRINGYALAICLHKFKLTRITWKQKLKLRKVSKGIVSSSKLVWRTTSSSFRVGNNGSCNKEDLGDLNSIHLVPSWLKHKLLFWFLYLTFLRLLLVSSAYCIINNSPKWLRNLCRPFMKIRNNGWH